MGLSVTNDKLTTQMLSSIGLADDVSLLAPSLPNLQALIHLTETFCKKYSVKLVPSKTKLLVYS